MNSASYTRARLAAVYDTLNPPEADSAYYLELAGEAPIAILDVGCGTGRLASELAARNHRVTGADPAPAMLDIARRREPGTVRWVEAAAAELSLPTRFDLIVMTGNVFQVFHDDASVDAALINLRRHLAPGGRLAFETRNPIVEEWTKWTPELTRENLTVEAIGAVEVWYDVTGVSGGLVTFDTHFRFADEHVVTSTMLRFMNRDAVAAHLAGAGFSHVAMFGDWDRSPFSDASPEIIVVAS